MGKVNSITFDFSEINFFAIRKAMLFLSLPVFGTITASTVLIAFIALSLINSGSRDQHRRRLKFYFLFILNLPYNKFL